MVTFFPAIPVGHACTLLAALRPCVSSNSSSWLSWPRSPRCPHPQWRRPPGPSRRQPRRHPRPRSRFRCRARRCSSGKARTGGSCWAGAGTSARTTCSRARLRLVRPARPHGLERDPRPAQLERHRPHAEPAHLGLVPQGVPAAARDPKGLKRAWKIRFEGSNYRTTVWLNGRKIGGFTGYFPFELDLQGLRTGRNSLVVRVSTLRSRTDLTHWRPARLQRLRLRRLVELRRPAARGVRPPGGHRGRGAGPGPPPRSQARTGPPAWRCARRCATSLPGTATSRSPSG